MLSLVVGCFTRQGFVHEHQGLEVGGRLRGHDMATYCQGTYKLGKSACEHVLNNNLKGSEKIMFSLSSLLTTLHRFNLLTVTHMLLASPLGFKGFSPRL